MSGLFNLKNPTPADFRRLQEGMRLQAANDGKRMALMPVMDDFMKFLARALDAVEKRAESLGKNAPLLNFELDYDPKAEPDRFFRETWNAWSDIWPLIETLPTYYMTMLTLLEKIKTPESGVLRFTSIGSGPGIYETYLAKVMDRPDRHTMFTCVDLAAEMASMQSFIANVDPPSPRNLHLVTADMSSLPLRSGSQDVVLCNNSLQWCKLWRQAIREMARVLDPKSLRHLHLVVHSHNQAMHVGTATGEKVVDMEPVLAEDVMDELNACGFVLSSARQIHGSRGMGQAGSTVERMFITARHEPYLRKIPSWRKSQVSVLGASLMSVGGSKP